MLEIPSANSLKPLTECDCKVTFNLQDTSDSQGEVVFELDEFISENGEGTYYFEAFTEIQNGFAFESVTHPDFNIEEGKSITSSIIVE